MIDYEKQEQDRLENPAVPDDIKWLGGTFADAAHWLQKIYGALRRQESPNPTIINLNPLAGNAPADKGIISQTTVRLRCQWLVFSGGTANDVFILKIGSASVFDWVVPAQPSPWYIPLPIVLDAGVDVQVQDQTTQGATNWRCRIIGYAELEEGNA